MPMAFDPGRAYEKHPQVAIRPEPFGGLAYHFGNRLLVFLKAPELVTLVEALADFPSATAAIDACVPPPRRAACAKALSSLLGSGLIRVRPVTPASVPRPARGQPAPGPGAPGSRGQR
jgi:putative mycofactocin binding protein MftB